MTQEPVTVEDRLLPTVLLSQCIDSRLKLKLKNRSKSATRARPVDASRIQFQTDDNTKRFEHFKP